MTSARATFRQVDITRAIKAVEKAGLTVAEVEITKEGSILVRSEGNLSSNGKRRHPIASFEERLANAPWAKEKSPLKSSKI